MCFLCFRFFSRQSCNPLVLFEAEIEKYCPENFVDIKVGSFGRPMTLELSNHKTEELVTSVFSGYWNLEMRCSTKLGTMT